MVVPTGKESPGAAVRVTRLACPEMSKAVGSVKKTGALEVPSSTSWNTLLGQLTEGGVVSTEENTNQEILNINGLMVSFTWLLKKHM